MATQILMRLWNGIGDLTLHPRTRVDYEILISVSLPTHRLHFPRWLYQEFFYRYRVLCKTKDIKRNDMRVTCENILSNLIKVSFIGLRGNKGSVLGSGWAAGKQLDGFLLLEREEGLETREGS